MPIIIAQALYGMGLCLGGPNSSVASPRFAIVRREPFEHARVISAL